MLDKELDERIAYIKPVDASLLARPESENYARYRRGLPLGVAVDCVTEDGGAFDPNREEVRHLRLSGLDLKEIAERTGMPQEQVEIYCRQLGLPLEGSCRLCVDVDRAEEGNCVYCGGPLPYDRKRFCCDRCMNAFYYRKKRGKGND